MIHVRALGPVELTVNGAPAPKELSWRKNVALVVYLARSPRRARTREHLVGLLWPEKPESAARQSLNEALRHLRKHVGESALDTEGGQVRIAPGGVVLDTDELDERIAAGDWAGAAALAGGQFLEGFGVADASELETWLAAERKYWCSRSVEALTRRADQLSDEGYSLEAADLAHRAFDLDRDSGVAVRSAMRCLVLGGDRAGALELYDDFARRLRDLATEPDAETRALAERIRKERAPRRPKPQVPAAPSRRAPLTGASGELAALLGVWAASRAGRAGVGLVQGDPGTGKTRLLEEVAARARLDGGAVLAARAVDADRAEPGASLRALARGGLLDAPGIAAAPPAALAAFARDDSDWAARFPDAARTAPLPVAAAFSVLLREAAAEQPLAIALDDAQYADDESLQTLAAAARDLARLPVLILLAAGPAPARDGIDAIRARLGRDVPGATVRRGPFDHANLLALVHWALPAAKDDEAERLARRLAADTGGLPLLAVELIHAIAGGAELPAAGVAWPKPGQTLDDTLPGDLPDAIVAAIRVNYHRMSEASQRVLQVVAVLGVRVAIPLIARVASRVGDPFGDALGDALDDCEWQRWLVSEPRGYSYVARIVRQVIERDMITAGGRRRILEAAALP